MRQLSVLSGRLTERFGLKCQVAHSTAARRAPVDLAAQCFAVLLFAARNPPPLPAPAVAAQCTLEALKLVTMCSSGLNNYMM